MITNSYFTTGPAQADGRHYVTEKHDTDDGQTFTYEYLADANINSQFVLEERADLINKTLTERIAAKTFVIGTEVPLTKYEFLGRFTTAERVAIRNTAKTNPVVDDFMEMMKLSGNVSLILARPGLLYLQSLGILTADRTAIIGAN